ncbi:hypothetical protein RCL1_009071 [Eukaryota sp. TZLM3-RCL]
MSPKRPQSLDVDQWIQITSLLACRDVCLTKVLNLIRELCLENCNSILTDVLSFALTRFPSSMPALTRACKSSSSKKLLKNVYGEVFELASLPLIIHDLYSLKRIKSTFRKAIDSVTNQFALIAFFDSVAANCPIEVAGHLFSMFQDVSSRRSFLGPWKNLFSRATSEGVLMSCLPLVVFLPIHVKQGFIHEFKNTPIVTSRVFTSSSMSISIKNGTVVIINSMNDLSALLCQELALRCLMELEIVENVRYCSSHFPPKTYDVESYFLNLKNLIGERK